MERFTELSATGFGVSKVELRDESGDVVIAVTDLKVELDTLDDLADLLFGGEKISLVFPHVRAETAHVRLTPGNAGETPSLVRAFELRPASVKAEQAPKRPPRHVRVLLAAVEVGQLTGSFGYDSLTKLEPRFAQVHGNVLFSPKGVALDVHRFGLALRGALPEELRGTGRLKLRAPGALEAAFNGFAGDVELRAAASLTDSRLSAEVLAPSAAPEALRQLFPAWPFQEPLGAHVNLEGNLPKLELKAEGSLGEARLHATGSLNASADLSGALDFSLSQVDLRSVNPTLPKTAIDASGQLLLKRLPSGPELRVSGKSQEFEISEVPVPPVDFTLFVDAQGVRGEARIFEPHAPIETSFEVGRQTKLDARIPHLPLDKSRRLPAGLSGVTSLVASLELEDEALVGYAKGDVHHFSQKDIKLKHASFEVRSHTDLRSPIDTRVDGTIHANDVQLGSYALKQVSLSAQGTRHGARVAAKASDNGNRRLELKGRVLPGFAVSDADFALSQGPVTISGRLRELDLAVGRVHLERVSVTGAGDPFEGTLRLQPGLAEGRFVGDNLRLDAVAEALGMESATLRGRLKMNTEFSIGSEVRRGTLNAELSQVSVLGFGRSDARLFAKLKDQSLSVTWSGSDTLGINFYGGSQLQLDGEPLELDSWRRAIGTAELTILGIPVTGAELLAPRLFSAVEGEVGARVLVQRATADSLPTILIEAGSNALDLAVKNDEQTLQLPRLVPHFSAVFNGDERLLHSSGEVRDPLGTLLTFTASAALDADRWLRDPALAFREFRQVPLSVVVNLPPRAFDQFPVVGPKGVSGQLSAQLTLTQTINDPLLGAQVVAHDVSIPGTTQATPIGVHLSAQYAPIIGDLSFQLIGTSLGRSVVLGNAKGKLPWQTWTAQSPPQGQAPWNLRGSFAIDRFPLRVFAPLADLGIRGEVSGRVDLDSQKSLLLAELDLEGLASGRATLGNGTLRIKGSPGRILGDFSLADQARTLNLKLVATGRSTQIPLPHEIDNVDVAVRARRFSASAFSPFMEGLAARINGDVEADLDLFLDKQPARNGQLPTWTSSLSGGARLDQGSAYIDAIGLELRDIAGTLRIRPLGTRSEVALDSLQAKARSTEVNVEAASRFIVEGTRVLSGSGEVTLRGVPITVQGLNLGKATGRATSVFQRGKNWDIPGPHQGKDFMLFEVDVSHSRLKAARTASRNLVELKENSDIVVLQTAAPIGPDPDILPLRFVIRLGEEVAFSLAELNLPMSGETRIDFTEASKASGVLSLVPGGRVPILGKVFEVTSGRLTLDPDEPANPGINLNLSGRSDRGEPIFLTIGGTLREPITEPPIAQLRSLLGGAGSVLSGGVQALGVNELLGNGVTNVELRVSASEEQSEQERPSYTAAVEVRENLWFEGTYQRGEETGVNSAQTDSSFSGTIDYRFHPNWSLKTKAGTTGGSVDLLWQYRY